MADAPPCPETCPCGGRGYVCMKCLGGSDPDYHVCVGNDEPCPWRETRRVDVERGRLRERLLEAVRYMEFVQEVLRRGWTLKVGPEDLPSKARAALAQEAPPPQCKHEACLIDDGYEGARCDDCGAVRVSRLIRQEGSRRVLRIIGWLPAMQGAPGADGNGEARPNDEENPKPRRGRHQSPPPPPAAARPKEAPEDLNRPGPHGQGPQNGPASRGADAASGGPGPGRGAGEGGAASGGPGTPPPPESPAPALAACQPERCSCPCVQCCSGCATDDSPVSHHPGQPASARREGGGA